MFSLLILVFVSLVIAAGVTVVFQKPVLGAVGAVATLVIGLVLSSITVISAGHTGVVVTLGEVNQTTLSEGLHLVNPISQVKEVDVRLSKTQLAGASASTKDLQQVHTDIVVQYRLNAAHVPRIYKEFGLDVDNKVLGPAINEAFKTVTAHYTSEELITKRGQVSDEIQSQLTQKVAPFNIDVSGISLVNFGFSAEYQKAIEAKVIATQQKQKAEQDLERIKVEAQSRIAQAEGEAKAIAIQASAIQNQGGAAYVQLKAIEKWDGNLPNVMSGAMPFINVGK